MRNTTVSVTKGIDRAEVGGLGCVALCVGGKGDAVETCRLDAAILGNVLGRRVRTALAKRCSIMIVPAKKCK